MEEMIVYILHHSYEQTSEGEDEVKLIGVFSTHDKAVAAIDELKRQPGFKDHPEGFSIEGYTLNDYSWREGFFTVFG